MIRLHRIGEYWYAKNENKNLFFAFGGIYTKHQWVEKSRAAGFRDIKIMQWVLSQHGLRAKSWVDSNLREHLL